MKKRGEIISITAVYILLIIVWQLAYYILTQRTTLVKPYIFPNPLGVIKTFAKLASNNTLITAILSSFKKLLLGYLLSIATGICLGMNSGAGPPR